jgi:hypothetical protein
MNYKQLDILTDIIHQKRVATLNAIRELQSLEERIGRGSQPDIENLIELYRDEQDATGKRLERIWSRMLDMKENQDAT